MEAAFGAPEEGDLHPIALRGVVHRVVERHAERDGAEGRALPPRRDEGDRRDHVQPVKGHKGVIPRYARLVQPDIKEVIDIDQYPAGEHRQSISRWHRGYQWNRHGEMLSRIGHGASE